MSVCSLAGGAMEEQYLQVVKKHAEGEQGKRGCDRLAQLFGQLVDTIEETRKDILGDLFQGAITYGEAGQFYTPETITQLMAEMTLAQDESENGAHKRVLDPCCGSGRMLLSVATRNPHWEFVGQDIDLRCVRMTAINLALWNRYGYVIWGDSLREEQKLIYRTGFNGRGFVREVPLAEGPRPEQPAAAVPTEPSDTNQRKMPDAVTPTMKPTGPSKQLRFF